jgi:hypothetical protein
VFTRTAEAAAWLHYVERPPFNIHSFNHWQFHLQPIKRDNTWYTTHYDADDLTYLPTFLTSLKGNRFTRQWPYSFAVKITLSLIAESVSPLHASELWSSEFPNGDLGGKLFNVRMNGHDTTLFDAWETGCGVFKDNLQFTAADWAGIDSWVATLTAAYPDPGTAFDQPTALATNLAFTTATVYPTSLHKGDTLTSAYIATCQTESKRLVATAGWAIANVFKDVPILLKIVPPMELDQLVAAENNVHGREAAAVNRAREAAAVNRGSSKVLPREIIAWGIFGVAAIVAVILVYLTWCRKREVAN